MYRRQALARGGMLALAAVVAPLPLSATAASVPSFVTRSGKIFLLNGKPFIFHSATIYGQLGHLSRTIPLAQKMKLNVLSIKNFLDGEKDPHYSAQESRWRSVDKAVTMIGQAGLRAILDLSPEIGVLRRSGISDPFTYDNGAWYTAFANRVNTVSGVVYKNDPSIAMFDLAGEPPAPNFGNNWAHVTTQQLTAFYVRSSNQLRAADPNHLISTGGFLFVDNHYPKPGWSGIDWHAIFSAPNIDCGNTHPSSMGDVGGLPATADYVYNTIGKPCVSEEMNFPQSMGDQARADVYQKIYTIRDQHHMGGVGFWNLGFSGQGSYDVNDSTPIAQAVIIANAPRG